jgi:hypothetical protein
LAEALAKAYGGAWPKGEVRVDVAAHTNWAGAYTTGRFGTHIVLSSTDPGYQKLGGFEMLFHETSHSGSLIDPVHEGLRKAFGEHGMRPPRDLWHVVLFYTSGEVVRRRLAEEGIEYQAYAEREGVYDGRWRPLRPLLDGTWERYLAGEITREEAYAAMVKKWRETQAKAAGD